MSKSPAAASKTTSLRPWYAGGLRFKCTGCGACCTGEPGYVWIDADETAQLAMAIGMPLGDFKERYTRQVRGRTSLLEHSGGDCALFDPVTRRCRVYRSRPRQCRTWPFWPSNLGSRDAWLEVCDRCPGSGRGPLVPLEQIKAQRAAASV